MKLIELASRSYFPSSLLKRFAQNGVTTVDAVLPLSREDILRLEGVGLKSLEYLEEALAEQGYFYDESNSHFAPLPPPVDWSKMDDAELRWRAVEALASIALALQSRTPRQAGFR